MKTNQHRTQKGGAKIEITFIFTKRNNFKSSKTVSHFLKNEFLVLVVLFEVSDMVGVGGFIF